MADNAATEKGSRLVDAAFVVDGRVCLSLFILLRTLTM